jgi:hypothetical protein
VDNDEIARLTAALRAVRAELDALPSGTRFLDSSAQAGSALNPQALRYRKAVRDAAVALERSRTSFNSEELNALRRALESLLMDVPR